MEWFKRFADYHNDPRFLKLRSPGLRPLAIEFMEEAKGYCARHETDGRIHHTALLHLCRDMIRDAVGNADAKDMLAMILIPDLVSGA
jgi:hypothetical protein